MHQINLAHEKNLVEVKKNMMYEMRQNNSLTDSRRVPQDNHDNCEKKYNEMVGLYEKKLQ